MKLEADDSTITSDTTDANGEWDYAANGSPGPWYWVGVDPAPDPDVTRAGSSRSFGSFGAGSIYEMVYALRILGNGVIDGFLNEFSATYDGAGLDYDIDTGGALIKGVPCIFPSATDHAITSSRDATNPKQCYILLEVTPPGQSAEGKAVIKDICGTAAASPSLPSLTQDETLYQYPLASFRLPNTSSTTLTQATDLRTFLPGRNPVVSSVARRTDPTSEATTTSTTGADATSLTTTPTLLNGVTYDVHARCFLQCKISDAAQTAQVAVYLNGTSNISTYVTTNGTSYVSLANAHDLEVAGSGGTISCGVRIKVSGGTMTYSVGMLEVIAIPRS